MKVYFDVEQGSLDWHLLRHGKIGGTASSGLFVKSDTLFYDLLAEKTERFDTDLIEEGFQSDAMMRGTELEPEARKQEILETAMKLFAEKGYEKTSISDIAKEIGVAQGLCYRYFPSKDILFQTAVNEYANILVDKLKTNINIEQDSIKDILNHMEVLSESTNDTYYDTFHDEKNKTFHDLLSLSICKKLVPVVVKLIKKANVTGELNISDVESYANFCVYGQLGILTDDNLTPEEKNRKIKAILFDLFKL